eukprot:TRINITY_DN80601_c0_g1_i1.p2 TRINITY_DN80601_c0_g1~~TRINITY_DN80601_c0_g1_i1.p2  ORF type:complete len:158 (+),score=59.28 TRINITY_DN80601_c0_g1_i1:69-542(+)
MTMGSLGPQSNMLRSKTEFVKTADQLGGIRMRQERDPQQEKIRKSMLKLEAQKLADAFLPRVRTIMDEDEMDEYTVVKHSGDMYRRFLAKVKIAEESYMHLCARRSVKKKDGDWICHYALDKDEDDALLENDPDYDALPKTTVCSATGMDGGACSIQ